MNFLKDIIKPKTRKYLYKIVLTLIPLLTAYGLLAQEMAPLIGALAASILSVAVADGNVDKDEEQEELKHPLAIDFTDANLVPKGSGRHRAEDVGLGE